jgi:chromosome segregation ATPase
MILMAGEQRTILDEIDALLAAPQSATSELGRIEDTLTVGYAHALALEAEQLRLERRLAELAAELAAGASEQRAEELASVLGRMSSTTGDLTHLRTLLGSLRERVSMLRRETAPRFP